MIRRVYEDLDDYAAAQCCTDTQVLPRGRVSGGASMSAARVGNAVVEFSSIRSDVIIQEVLRPGRVQITWPVSRQDALSVDGRPLHWGEALVAWPSTPHVAVARAGARFLSVTVPQSQFVERCAALLGTACSAVNEPGLCVPSSSSFSRAYGAVSVLFHFASRYPQLARRPRLDRVTNGMVIDALVGLLRRSESPPLLGRSVTVPRVIRTVQRLLNEYKDDEITLRRLRAELNVSERTLRAVFNRVYGTSPARYLRLRRLGRARRALKRADPAHASVAALAADQGFLDFGRFAHEYQRIFGEYPSETLRRS